MSSSLRPNRRKCTRRPSELIELMCFPPSLCPFQLEESEFTSAAAVKARKSMEVEIEDLHVQMEDISRAKQAVSAALHPLGFMKQKFSPISWCDATAGAVSWELYDFFSYHC